MRSRTFTLTLYSGVSTIVSALILLGGSLMIRSHLSTYNLYSLEMSLAGLSLLLFFKILLIDFIEREKVGVREKHLFIVLPIHALTG